MYEELTLLYRGGKDLKDNASHFLVKHSKELGSAYLSRNSKINYDNVLATVVSWYISKLFEHELGIDLTDQTNALVDQFYSDFLKNCDNGETSLKEFFERVSVEVLVYGKSHFLIDLPKLSTQPTRIYAKQSQMIHHSESNNRGH